jgi:hypothetical protein
MFAPAAVSVAGLILILVLCWMAQVINRPTFDKSKQLGEYFYVEDQEMQVRSLLMQLLKTSGVFLNRLKSITNPTDLKKVTFEMASISFDGLDTSIEQHFSLGLILNLVSLASDESFFKILFLKHGR